MNQKQSTCIDMVVDILIGVRRVGEVPNSSGGTHSNVFLRVCYVSFDRHGHRCSVCYKDEEEVKLKWVTLVAEWMCVAWRRCDIHLYNVSMKTNQKRKATQTHNFYLYNTCAKHKKTHTYRILQTQKHKNTILTLTFQPATRTVTMCVPHC